MFIWKIRTDKTFYASYLRWYVFPFNMVQFANICKFLLTKARRVLNRLSKCVNVRYRKTPGVFIVLPLSQNKNEQNLAHYFWDIYQEKSATKFNKVLWWALRVWYPRSFHNSFFAKSYYLSLNFFQKLQSNLLKNKRSSQKRCKPP